MGRSAEHWADRQVRGPQPDQADDYVMQMARVVRARHTRRIEHDAALLDLLRHGAARDTTDTRHTA
jgi:hypothetical protein